MPHDTPLISTIVVGLVLAFIFGAIANRLKMPPLVGYLVAGVVVGPYTPGFIGDTGLALELSEIGVILLMFGVGLHFSLRDLLSVRSLAVPGALLRMIGGMGMGVLLGLAMGWSIGAGLLFGLALSVASTVVLLKTLHDHHLVDSDKGRIAIGWVIVEDIAMILALVLIPSIASIWGLTDAAPDDPFVNLVERLLNTDIGVVGIVSITVLKLAAFVGFMLVVGRRLIPMLLHYTAHTGSRELFRLAVLAIALGVAAGAAYLFGVSLALGAFFAGMILSESELSHRAAEESLPLRDAFSVLFFVAVGMLFDPSILWRDPLPVLATLFIILFGKSIIAFFVVLLFGRPVSSALTISASLAQIGEFSFILATLGLALGILPPEGRDLILAGAIISIILNPLMVWAADRLRPALEARLGPRAGEAEAVPGGRVEPSLGGPGAEPAPAAAEEEPLVHPTALTDHTVLVGYGRVGSVVADGLKAAHQPFLVIEDAEGRIAAAHEKGIEVVVGNAASSGPLKLANVEGARTVVVAIPNAFEAGQAVEQARKANPSAVIVARAHSDEEEEYLEHLGANAVILGEREIGAAMLDLVNRDLNAVAEITGRDAVEAAIGPQPSIRSGPARPPADAAGPPLVGEVLPPATGPLFTDVEPPAALADVDEEELARALGEMGVADAGSGPAGSAEAAAEIPSGPGDAIPFKAQRPARTPAMPFNPETEPDTPREPDEDTGAVPER